MNPIDPTHVKPHWRHANQCTIADLNHAIGELHQAVQLIAATSKSLLEAKDDDSHTNLGWNSESNTVYGRTLPDGFSLGLAVPEMELYWIDGGQPSASFFPLRGKTVTEAQSWIHETLNEDVNWAMHYDIPDHPLQQGAIFTGEPKTAFADWANWRHNGQLFIAAYAEHFEHASDIRIWPHHFDSGSYIPQEHDEQGGALNSISLGLGMADTYCGGPYFYITHWSREELTYPEDLPALAAGQWNRKDFIGAILPLSDLLDLQDTDAQIDLLNQFFASGIAASFSLLSV